MRPQSFFFPLIDSKHEVRWKASPITLDLLIQSVDRHSIQFR